MAIGLAVVFGSFSYAGAHDFWLAPENYQVEQSGVVPVEVLIGHTGEQSSWPLNAHRVIALRSVGQTVLRISKPESTQTDKLSLTLVSTNRGLT